MTSESVKMWTNISLMEVKLFDVRQNLCVWLFKDKVCWVKKLFPKETEKKNKKKKREMQKLWKFVMNLMKHQKCKIFDHTLYCKNNMT